MHNEKCIVTLITVFVIFLLPKLCIVIHLVIVGIISSWQSVIVICIKFYL